MESKKMKYTEYHPMYQLGNGIGNGISWCGFWIMVGLITTGVN